MNRACMKTGLPCVDLTIHTYNDNIQEDDTIEVYLARVPQLPFLFAWDAELVAEGPVLLKHLQYVDQQIILKKGVKCPNKVVSKTQTATIQSHSLPRT